MPPAPRPRTRSVRLVDLAALLALTTDVVDRTVSGVTLDSRAVQPGDVFAALPGRSVHGAMFASSAVDAGAAAILTDPVGATICAELAVPVLVVADPRSRLGAAAAFIYGDPGTAMQLIGITGTNGKTTVAAMVESGLRAGGHSTGMIGTIGVMIAGQSFTGVRTTPEATDLHAILAVMRDEGVSTVVMEVSSIALDERRVDGVVYDIAAFTNLSQDHLDYHGSMAAYFDAKAELFIASRARRAVIGIDDEWGRRLNELCTLPRETWSTVDTHADWTVSRTGDALAVEGPIGERQQIDVALPGEFNIANALCAYAILRLAGVDAGDAAAGIARATVPGRMQVIDQRSDVLGIVDYAHSPDAVRRVLEELAIAVMGRVIVVVGAGGDRDISKRAAMGAIAARLADVVIVTDDNPRSEDPAAIRAAVLGGAADVDRDARAEIHEEADRGRAITVAVAMAEAGDAVVVLGKGHEQGQEVAGAVTPFDDATTLARALGERTHR